MPRLVLAYVRAVLSHWWWIALAVVGAAGDAATVVGAFGVPRQAWYALIAVGLIAAQFRAYCDVMAQLAAVRARLRELDSVEARKAYIDEEIDHALGLRREFEQVVVDVGPVGRLYAWQDTKGVGALIDDVSHWESGVRAVLKEWFSFEDAARFSDDDIEPPSPDSDGRLYASKENCLAYLDRRLARLRQIRKRES